MMDVFPTPGAPKTTILMRLSPSGLKDCGALSAATGLSCGVVTDHSVLGPRLLEPQALPFPTGRSASKQKWLSLLLSTEARWHIGMSSALNTATGQSWVQIQARERVILTQI